MRPARVQSTQAGSRRTSPIATQSSRSFSGTSCRATTSRCGLSPAAQHWALSYGQLPVGAHEMAGVAGRIPFKVVLVLGLGLPKVASRGNLGHNLAGPQPGGIDVGDCVFGDPLLFLARVEDR